MRSFGGGGARLSVTHQGPPPSTIAIGPARVNFLQPITATWTYNSQFAPTDPLPDPACNRAIYLLTQDTRNWKCHYRGLGVTSLSNISSEGKCPFTSNPESTVMQELDNPIIKSVTMTPTDPGAARCRDIYPTREPSDINQGFSKDIRPPDHSLEINDRPGLDFAAPVLDSQSSKKTLEFGDNISFVKPQDLNTFLKNFEQHKSKAMWLGFSAKPISRSQVCTVTILVHNESLPVNNLIAWLSRYGDIVDTPTKILEKKKIWTG
ncbi:hypothetical protein XELAEV_18030652mg [Xenopus laevis]|uniref:Zinc finger CCHC domain-containing protein n=1 Tax=Xenopus laevis TaxID=8355 RepID=A0A974CL86_XENLA|nr:hypothetical protein XELAEV_18030652mg [Xenopus laevis]